MLDAVLSVLSLGSVLICTIKGRKNWCLTIYDMTTLPTEASGAISYFVYQKEKCPTTGRIHYQCYLQAAKRLRFSQLKGLFPTAHIEPQRAANSDKARDYCMKADTQLSPPVEYGTYVPQKQGARSDLRDLYDDILEGKPEHVLWADYTSQMFRYHKKVDYLIQFGMSKTLPGQPIRRRTVPQVILCYGPTGSGKTSYFYDNSPVATSWEMPIQSGSTLWFDGLHPGHTHVLIDDFNGGIKLVQLLRLLDVRAVKVEVKGGHTTLCATHIYVTSNYHPDTWYDYSTRMESHAALRRRFTKLLYFTAYGTPPVEYTWDTLP